MINIRKLSLMKKITRKIRSRKKVLQCTFYGMIAGFFVGAIGTLFQIFIEWLSKQSTTFFHVFDQNFFLQVISSIIFSVIFVVIPVCIVRYFVPKASGSGVHEIEGILEDKRTMCWWKILLAKFIGGIMSLSSGLVIGREGPTIQMGGAIGQAVSKLLKLDDEYMHILVAAGAGAGLATAFNAPLAGILFVIEEMRHQFRFSFKAFQTVTITCVVADITLQVILQANGYDIKQLMGIDMTAYTPPPLSSFWIFLMFGVIFGVLGVVFNKFLLETLNFFTKRSGFHYWKWVIIVASMTGALVVIFPKITGGGYNVIPEALHGNISIEMLVILCLLRFLMTLASYGTGVPGGIFAPMIALGTIFGMFFGIIMHTLFPALIPDPQVFAVAGMSALFAATVSAPLTGIVLVVEMTTNYALILPLILTCFSATIAAGFMHAQPIYSTLLSRTIVLSKRKSLYLNNTGGFMPLWLKNILKYK